MTDLFTKIILGIGVPSIVGGLIFVGWKLKTLDALEKDMDQEVKPTLKKLDKRVLTLWIDRFGVEASKSPKQLTDKGRKILEESGMKKIVDSLLPKLYEKVKALNPKNELQVYQSCTDVLSELQKNPDILNQLETGAYQSGVDDIELLFVVGGLYLRDLLLPKFDFRK